MKVQKVWNKIEVIFINCFVSDEVVHELVHEIKLCSVLTPTQAVYGVLSAIEGLRAFDDLTAHTKIKPWYNAVKERVEKQEGSTLT